MTSIMPGCPLKRFLHVPQEAAGGYNKRESLGVLSDLLSLILQPLRPVKLMHPPIILPLLAKFSSVLDKMAEMLPEN